MYDVLVFDHRLAEHRPLDSKSELARLLFGYTTGNGQRFPAQPDLVRFVARPGKDSDVQGVLTGHARSPRPRARSSTSSTGPRGGAPKAPWPGSATASSGSAEPTRAASVAVGCCLKRAGPPREENAQLMRTARRIDAIPPYLFAEIDRKIAERKAAGVDVISFGVGDPDLPTPDFVVEELARAAGDPSTHQYPSYFGLPSFRRAVADFYRRRFGVELDPDTQVLPLIGSKEGIAHLPWAFVDPGDQVLVTEPGYPVYEVGTILAGGEPVHIPLTAEDGWFPDFAAVDPGTAPGPSCCGSATRPTRPARSPPPTSSGGGPVRGRPRPAARLRQRLLRDHLRRLRRPVGPPGPGRGAWRSSSARCPRSST